MATGYVIVPSKIPADKPFKGQAKLIADAMTTDVPLTSAAIANIIKGSLVTRQDPERVVAFYMSVWKKKGIVVPHTVDSPPAPVTPGTSPEPATAVETVAPQTEEPAQPAFPNLHGRKLSEGVVEVLRYKPGGLDARGITSFLGSHGYEFRENQVNSALTNLVRAGKITAVSDGVYDLAAQ